MKRAYIHTFDGGVTGDSHDHATNKAQLIQHFDIFTKPNVLSPYRSAESGDSSVSDNQIANYAYNGTTVWGLGVATGSPIPKIFTRTNFTDAVWTADAGGYSIAGSVRAEADIPFFTFYRKTGKLYGVRNGSNIWSVVPATSANTTDEAITYTNVTNGLVHSQDDCLYMAYHDSAGKTSYVAKNNNDTWTLQALALPSNMIPVSICEYGTYLAIACREFGGLRSRVYLWNRDTSLTTVTESIDWGEGNIGMIEELEGFLVGVSFVGTTGSFSFKGRTIFRYYAGAGGAKQFQELTGFSQAPAIGAGLSTGLGCFKQKVRNRVLFSASVSIATSGNIGVWSISKDLSGSFSVTQETVLLNTAASMYGFILLGDYQFTSYVNSSTWYQDKTNDSELYNTTSVYETTINQGMDLSDRPMKKQLVSVSLIYSPLPTAGQVVLKYRVDASTAWASATTIFTETTDSASASEFTKAGSTEFTSGREYEFRIESTGGAEITGIVYKYNILTTNI